MGLLHSPSSDTNSSCCSTLRILLKIRDFPGAKSARNEFSLPDGKLTNAKMSCSRPLASVRFAIVVICTSFDHSFAHHAFDSLFPPQAALISAPRTGKAGPADRSWRGVPLHTSPCFPISRQFCCTSLETGGVAALSSATPPSGFLISQKAAPVPF